VATSIRAWPASLIASRSNSRPYTPKENAMTTKELRAKKRLYMFEKEKGGVGSTAALAAAAHVAMLNGAHVVFIEASMTQLDIKNAYGRHHPVHTVDLTVNDASDRFIDIIAEAPDGAAIFANIPGGRFEEIDEVHNIIRFALEQDETLNVDVTIVWTLGLDKASRVTLDAMLAGDPPGRVLLNLPAWHGERDDFVEVNADVEASIEETGGFIFQTPALRSHLYDLFRGKEIALDQIKTAPGVSFGNRMAFGLWEREAVDALGAIF